MCTKRKFSKRFTIIGFGFFSLAVLSGLVSRQIDLPSSNGGDICIRPASLWQSMFWSTCDIQFQPRGVELGVISLTQSWTDRPIIFVPSEDKKELLCLYELEDMGLKIVKFNTAKSFEPFPPSPSDHNLREMVRKSPWKAQVGDLNDWKYLYQCLKGMSTEEFKRQSLPQADVGFLRLYRSKTLTLTNMETIPLDQNIN